MSKNMRVKSGVDFATLKEETQDILRIAKTRQSAKMKIQDLMEEVKEAEKDIVYKAIKMELFEFFQINWKKINWLLHRIENMEE